MFFLSSFITWGCNVCFGYDKFINYLSPTILLNAMIMVVLFSRFHLKGEVLSQIAPLALGVYLFHLNPVIWTYFKNMFSLLTLKPIGIGILYILLYSYIIVVLGLMIEWVRRKLAKRFKMEEISKGIVKMIESLLLKMSFILK